MGTGFAGSASRGTNSSFLFYNPASIVLNSDVDVTGDFKLFFPSVEIVGSAATRPAFPGPGAPVVGVPSTGEMADNAIAPTFFASYALTPDLRVGIAGTAPFAAVIDTDKPWLGRFHLTETEIVAYNVNPVVAYRFNEMFSIGFGAQLQYLDTTFKKTQAFPPPFGLGEGEGFLEGGDIGFGFTAGLLIQPSAQTTFGVGYRSRIEHTLIGSAGLNGGPVPVPDQGVEYDITTPDIVTASISHQFNEYLTGHATFEWANWSLFDAIVVEFDSGMPDDVRPQNWEDTYAGFAGLSYMLDESTVLHVGGGFTPATANGSGSSILPAGDKVSIAVGFSHQMSETWTFDASYSHIFFSDVDLTPSSFVNGSLVGTSHLDLDILGVSLTGHW